MSILSQGYDQLCNLIIRPPRFTYDIDDLGPKTFRLGKVIYVRDDVELPNERGLKLQCSHYHPKNQQKTRPCVIYAHGNCGSRLDGTSILESILPFSNVLTLDFSGSGLSEGEYISLGAFEKNDLKTAVNWLRASANVGRVALWGRSMGAATSIFYAHMDPSVAGMILDSPFSSLKKLSEELVEHSQIKIPKLMVSVAMKAIRKSVQKKAKFDINDLEPIKYVEQCFIPALFVHGENDAFIAPQHSKDLYEKYAGDKNLVMVPGDHNSERPEFFMDSAAIFFHNVLLDQDDLQDESLQVDNSPEVHNHSEFHQHHSVPKDFDTMLQGSLADYELEMLQHQLQSHSHPPQGHGHGVSAHPPPMPGHGHGQHFGISNFQSAELDEDEELQRALSESLSLANLQNLADQVPSPPSPRTNSSNQEPKKEDPKKDDLISFE